MTTLTINREKLVKALADLEHVSGDDRITPWLVEVPKVADSETVEARVIWADTPSSMGGYCANMRGCSNYSPREFLDTQDGNDYAWGEQGTGSGENGEWTETDTENAMDWIDTNLAERVNLDDEWYNVKYV